MIPIPDPATMAGLSLRPGCGDPCCPAWCVMDTMFIEQCDDCCFGSRMPELESDAAAWQFIARTSGHQVVARRQRYHDGTFMNDSEEAAVRGEMYDADPFAVWGAHRIAAGLYRARVLGVDVSSVDLGWPANPIDELWDLLEEHVFCSVPVSTPLRNKVESVGERYV